MMTTIATIQPASESANTAKTNKMNILLNMLQERIKEGKRGVRIEGDFGDFHNADLMTLRNKGYILSESSQFSSLPHYVLITW